MRLKLKQPSEKREVGAEAVEATMNREEAVECGEDVAVGSSSTRKVIVIRIRMRSSTSRSG